MELMARWKKPYRDWRLVMWYPLLVATPTAMLCSAVANDLSTAMMWLGSIAALMVMVWIWRVTRLGVFLDDGRVKVTSLFRSRVMAWPDIAKVEDVNLGVARQIGFVLISGEKVTTLAQTATFTGYEVYLTNSQYQDLLDTLRRRAEGRPS
jgi:Bacterial PH domain